VILHVGAIVAIDACDAIGKAMPSCSQFFLLPDGCRAEAAIVVRRKSIALPWRRTMIEASSDIMPGMDSFGAGASSH